MGVFVYLEDIRYPYLPALWNFVQPARIRMTFNSANECVFIVQLQHMQHFLVGTDYSGSGLEQVRVS